MQVTWILLLIHSWFYVYILIQKILQVSPLPKLKGVTLSFR